MFMLNVTINIHLHTHVQYNICISVCLFSYVLQQPWASLETETLHACKKYWVTLTPLPLSQLQRTMLIVTETMARGLK